MMSRSKVLRHISVLLALLESPPCATATKQGLFALTARVLSTVLDEILDDSTRPTARDEERMHLPPSAAIDSDMSLSVMSATTEQSASPAADLLSPPMPMIMPDAVKGTSDLLGPDYMGLPTFEDELIDSESFLAWCDRVQMEDFGNSA